MNEAQFKLRAAKPEDLNLILNSWLKTYRTSKFGFDVPSDIYYKYQEEKVRGLLQESEVLVAHDLEDVDHVFGYVCYTPKMISNVCVLHYVYVKKPFRTTGLFKELLNAAKLIARHHESMPLVVTHDTKHFKRAYTGFYVFNPYLAWNK